GWTQTRGFFALMGGFMLVNRDGTELCTLLPEKLDTLSNEGKIIFPNITKKEIEDKSKGDVISKGFVLLQTGWFILQCIARGVEHLPITELELVTLAFAVLNLATYALWWNKPQNVQCQIPVHLSDASSRPENAEGEFSEVPGIFERARRRIRATDEGLGRWFLMAFPFTNMGVSRRVTDDQAAGAKRLPSFYASETDPERSTAALASAGIALVFGAFHCIAWSFQFPSQEKEILWRTCSVVITCLPASMVLVGLSIKYLHEPPVGVGVLAMTLLEAIVFMTIFLLFILPIIYVVCRAILLLEAFILLHSLPPGAFRTVHWTNFIPHV
ncbi:hypothetical protein BD410DRAFT_733314, partial [Rickenella mellea]